jgi:uncharacterized protein
MPAHPGLYDPDQQPPSLNCSRCSECGTTFFPPLSIGCEVCGAPEASLQPVAVDATGVVHSVTTVRVSTGGDIDAPFTIAEIRLDAGPPIRGTMAGVVDRTVIGSRARAEFAVTRVDDEGREIVEPRFVVVGS